MSVTSQTAIQVIRALRRRYTKKADMDLGTPEDTILGVLLSAQTTDVQVLKAFPAFRKKFPTWQSLADAEVADIAKSISTIGLYRSKARAMN
ncbi:MAG: endonuclease III, partial [Patescibacteria group bacterium]